MSDLQGPGKSRVLGPSRSTIVGFALTCALVAGCGPGTDGGHSSEASGPATPYIVIRHDRPGVVFDDALYEALSRALERYPEARFDVVLAMPPLSAKEAPRAALAQGERQIEEVVWAMTDMGLPADRLYIAARTDETSSVNEVRIFVH